MQVYISWYTCGSKHPATSLTIQRANSTSRKGIYAQMPPALSISDNVAAGVEMANWADLAESAQNGRHILPIKSYKY